MDKCPRCELNYKDESEQFCSVCMKELQGKDETSEQDVCIICGSPNVLDGESLCESCLNKKSADMDIEKSGEYDVGIDGYSDLADTDIPDCDLEAIGEDMDEYDEQEDFEEE